MPASPSSRERSPVRPGTARVFLVSGNNASGHAPAHDEIDKRGTPEGSTIASAHASSVSHRAKSAFKSSCVNVHTVARTHARVYSRKLYPAAPNRLMYLTVRELWRATKRHLHESRTVSLHGKLLSKSLRGRDVQLLSPCRMSRWTAVSRGIAVDLWINNVGPIATSTAQALQKRGIIFNPPLARMPSQLEIADLESADHIVALNEAEHFPLMQERFPSWLGMSDPCRIEYWHVHNIDRIAPEQGLPLIAEQLQGLLKRLR
jgi:protein-tyrosine phosphatase